MNRLLHFKGGKQILNDKKPDMQNSSGVLGMTYLPLHLTNDTLKKTRTESSW